MRPVGISDFIGQRKLKEQIRVIRESAKVRNAPVPHLLASGPSGCGKSSLCRIMATESGKNFHEFNAAAISSYENIVEIFKSVKEKDFVFIDEIHAISPKVQEGLYIIMEDFQIEIKSGNQVFRKNLPPFTLIGATTHISGLNRALQRRFKHILQFERYSLEELSLLVKSITEKNFSFNMSDNFCKIIAKTCKGSPSQVVNRVEFIRDWVSAESQADIPIYNEEDAKRVQEVCSKIDEEKLLKIIEIQGVDKRGLDNTERDYLAILLDKAPFPISQTNISRKMGIEPKNILEIEDFFVKMGVVDVCSRGRRINFVKYEDFINGKIYDSTHEAKDKAANNMCALFD